MKSVLIALLSAITITISSFAQPAHALPGDFKGVEISTIRLQGDLYDRVGTEIRNELKRCGATDTMSGGTKFSGIVLWMNPMRDRSGRIQTATGIEVHVKSLCTFSVQCVYEGKEQVSLLSLAKVVTKLVVADLAPQVTDHKAYLASVSRKRGK